MNRSTTAARLPQHTSTHVAGGTFALVLLMATAGAVEPSALGARPAAGSRQGTTRTVVDADVRPAGGAVCRECGPGGCRSGHARHGHHRDCRDGACVPYCPVRPGTFGYYGTQWRRWPGQGVVPVSNVEAATPVQPPKSAIPDADEESFGPEPSDLPEPDVGAGAGESAGEPIAPEPDASPAVSPVEPSAPAAESREAPREMPREDAQPSKPADAEPAPTKPKDDNLFDDSAARKVRRKIPLQIGGTPRNPAESSVRATSHESVVPGTAKPRAVPRVAFDPRAESARLRQAQ